MNIKEVLIMITLKKARRPLSIKKISERIGFSWPTVNKYVKKLLSENKIIITKSKRRTYVEVESSHNTDCANKEDES